MAVRRAEPERWKTDHPGATADQGWFADVILPRLAKMKLSEIMAACGVAKSTASMIRSGRHVPALRHWDALEKVGSAARGSLHRV